MGYMAVYEEARTSTSLTKDSQMDEHLSKGANIYKVEGEEATLIATPQDGFLVERPVFPIKQTASLGISKKELEEIRAALGLKGE